MSISITFTFYPQIPEFVAGESMFYHRPHVTLSFTYLSWPEDFIVFASGGSNGLGRGATASEGAARSCGWKVRSIGLQGQGQRGNAGEGTARAAGSRGDQLQAHTYRWLPWRSRCRIWCPHWTQWPWVSQIVKAGLWHQVKGQDGFCSSQGTLQCASVLSCTTTCDSFLYQSHILLFK